MKYLYAFLAVFLLFYYACLPAFADIASEKLRASTVHIFNGTGFIAEGKSGSKYLVTNWHVCKSARWSNVLRGSLESGELVSGSITSENPRYDLCAARVYGKYPALVPAESIRVAEQIRTRGYPAMVLTESVGVYIGPQKWTYTYEIGDVGECFKGSKKVYDFQSKIEGCSITYSDGLTNLYSRPGSSGSPVVNQRGELVGVLSSWNANIDAGGMVNLEHLREFLGAL